MGRAEGISEEQLRNLHRFRDSDAFDPIEKLVLELAECCTATPARVPDDLFEALEKEFDRPALVELSSAIALENYRARFGRPFEVASEDFSERAFCPLPERPADPR